MSEKSKDYTAYTVAPLANVSLCASAVERALNRPSHLPGMVCMHGPAGWDKSTTQIGRASCRERV